MASVFEVNSCVPLLQENNNTNDSRDKIRFMSRVFVINIKGAGIV